MLLGNEAKPPVWNGGQQLRLDGGQVQWVGLSLLGSDGRSRDGQVLTSDQKATRP